MNVSNNRALTSLAGLEGIGFVEGTLTVEVNERLTSLAGLEGVTSIGGGLTVQYNEGLTSFAGLDNLTSLSGTARIAGNDTLTTLRGLESLAAIDGDLVLLYNPTLTSVTALYGVTSVGGNLDIRSAHCGPVRGRLRQPNPKGGVCPPAASRRPRPGWCCSRRPLLSSSTWASKGRPWTGPAPARRRPGERVDAERRGPALERLATALILHAGRHVPGA